MSSSEAVDNCALCHRAVVDPATTPCGHRLCAACLMRALEHPSVPANCPTCGKPLSAHPSSTAASSVFETVAAVQRDSARGERSSSGSGAGSSSSNHRRRHQREKASRSKARRHSGGAGHDAGNDEDGSTEAAEAGDSDAEAEAETETASEAVARLRDEADGDLDAALVAAVTAGNVEAVHILLRCGAEPSTQAVHCAAEGGHALVLVALLEAFGSRFKTEAADHHDSSDTTPLQRAATGGHLDCMRILLDAGASLTVRNFYFGTTALDCAASGGHLPAVQLLLEAGAPLQPTDAHCSYTPLHWACLAPDGKCVKALLEAGADVTARSVDKWTPLHTAAEKGNAEAVMLLLKAGAQVSAVDDDGKTPMAIASYNGQADCCDALLSHGGYLDKEERHAAKADRAVNKALKRKEKKR